MSQATVEFAELVRAAQSAADSARSFVGVCENCGQQARRVLVARTGQQQVYKCGSCGYTKFYRVTP